MAVATKEVAEDMEALTEDPAEVVEVTEVGIFKPDWATGLAPILPVETTTFHGETPAISAVPSALKAVGEMELVDLEEEAVGEETEALEEVVDLWGDRCSDRGGWFWVWRPDARKQRGRPSLAVLEAILEKRRNQLHQFPPKNLFFLQNFLKIEKTSLRFSSSLKTSIEERRVSILGSLYCKIFVPAKKINK